MVGKAVVKSFLAAFRRIQKMTAAGVRLGPVARPISVLSLTFLPFDGDSRVPASLDSAGDAEAVDDSFTPAFLETENLVLPNAISPVPTSCTHMRNGSVTFASSTEIFHRYQDFGELMFAEEC